MNRRAFLASSALAIPSASVPALAEGAETPTPDLAPLAAASIRERIKLVGKAFSYGTVAFPQPMPPEDLDAALALSDDDLEAVYPLLPFAEKYGVSLDWLLAGRVESLIHAARMAYQERAA